MGLFGDIFGGIGDVLSTPFDMAGNLLEGDFDGFLTAPFETLFEADILFGVDLGDIASFADDILDEVPMLKQAIVAAGFAAGGVGGLVAAAAIAATDTMSEINEGTFDMGDLAGGAMEFGGLYAGGALGAGAGNMLATTAGKVRMGTQVLGRSGLLGRDLSRVTTAAGAFAGAGLIGDLSQLHGIVGNSAVAIRDTGLIGARGNSVMNALALAAGGNPSDLRGQLALGVDVLRESDLLGADADPILSAVGTGIGDDYSSVASGLQSGAQILGTSGIGGDEGRAAAYLLNAGGEVASDDTDTGRVANDVFRAFAGL